MHVPGTPASLPPTLHGSMTVSIDVEDWHQLVTRRFRDELIDCTSNVERQTEGLLDRLDAANIKGTFFVLGLVAKAKPHLVRAIAERGHEIGSHGISHVPLFKLDRATLQAELTDSRKLLEDISGTEVAGFRAPEFSVRPDNLEALDAIALAGYRYDSSIFPIVHRRYGVPGFARGPVKITTPGGHSLWELPLATMAVGKTSLPLAGGGYFRLLPAAILRAMFQRNASHGEFSMLYFHPYEFADERLALPDSGLPLDAKQRAKAKVWLAIQAIGRQRVQARFDRVVSAFPKFIRANDLINALESGALS